MAGVTRRFSHSSVTGIYNTAIKQQLASQRLETSMWHSNSDYFIFCILMGNSLTHIPRMILYSIWISGGLFILLYVTSTAVFVLPLVYIFIFLGMYTRMTDVMMYRMSPLYFGFTVFLFIYNFTYFPKRMRYTGMIIITAVNLAVDYDRLDSCVSKDESCYCYSESGPIDKSCIKNMSGIFCNGTMKQFVAEHIYWTDFVSAEENSIWNGVIATSVSSILILLLCLNRMQIKGILLKISFVANIVIYMMLFSMAMSKNIMGVISDMVDFNTIQLRPTNFVEIALFTTLKYGIPIPLGYMTFSAYAQPRRFGPCAECLILTSCNLLLSAFYYIVHLVCFGYLTHLYEVTLESLNVPYMGMYCAMMVQFLLERKAAGLFIFGFLISHYALETVHVALSIQMHINNLYDLIPRLHKHARYVNVIMITTIYLMNLALWNFQWEERLYSICEIYYLHALILLVLTTMVFYSYGVLRLNDDIHFLMNTSPIRYWHVIWYLYPLMMIIFLFTRVSFDLEDTNVDYPIKYFSPPTFWKPTYILVSLAIIGVYILVVMACTFLYSLLDKTIRTGATKPKRDWGPRDKHQRILRKAFAPRTIIISQPPKTEVKRFRPNPIAQMHRKDFAERVTKTRIFMDSMFFSKLGYDR